MDGWCQVGDYASGKVLLSVGYKCMLRPAGSLCWYGGRKIVLGGPPALARLVMSVIDSLPLLGPLKRTAQWGGRKALTVTKWAVALGAIAGTGYCAYHYGPKAYGMMPDSLKTRVSDLGAASKTWARRK